MNALEVKNLSKRFGGLKAVESLSFSLNNGSVHALIGPNGAGKTTVLNLISRFYAADDGEIFVQGQNILTMRDYDIFSLGIARTFQNLEIFGDLSVFENVMTARFRFMKAGVISNMMRLPKSRAEEKENKDRIEKILSLVGLQEIAHKRAGSLPYGQQKLVELARAMALEPRVILLDEPAAGYNSEEVGKLGKLLLNIKKILGASILLVEHNMSLVMAISDKITVMHHGQFLAEGDPTEIEKNPAVIEAYLGKRYKPKSEELVESKDDRN